jgi:dsRNA-specific ribonuclease
MSVYLDEIKLGEGIGKSKKEATQEAAKAALSLMVRQ